MATATKAPASVGGLHSQYLADLQALEERHQTEAGLLKREFAEAIAASLRRLATTDFAKAADEADETVAQMVENRDVALKMHGVFRADPRLTTFDNQVAMAEHKRKGELIARQATVLICRARAEAVRLRARVMLATDGKLRISQHDRENGRMFWDQHLPIIKAAESAGLVIESRDPPEHSYWPTGFC
jgi:predicted secreted Zn-dependent protease